MPSVTELIELRDHAAAAQRDAQMAQANEKAAAKAASRSQQALDTARQQATEAKSKLDEINKAIAQIPVAQAELQATTHALADITTQLTELGKSIASVEAEIEHSLHTFPYNVPPDLLAKLNQLRQERQALEQRQQEMQTALAQAQTRLAQLQKEAEQLYAARRAADEAEGKVKQLEDDQAQLERAVQAASAQATAARATAQALVTQLQQALDQLIAGLDPEVPIALLPVRLETRFRRPAPNQPPSELLIRAYPDDIHQDTHELGLTNDEEQWGKHFWRETWRAGLATRSDTLPYAQRHAQELAAWQQLATRFGPTRAAYIARRLTPLNKDLRPEQASTDPQVPLSVEPDFDPNLVKRASSWTRAAQAHALPDRWLAIGYRGEQASNTQWGELIPASLHTGPDPSAVPAVSSASGPATPSVSMSVDSGMRWMVDFDEAEAKGMGIRMALSPEEATNGFDRLLVVGVKGTLSDPNDGAKELRELIEAHRFNWGCGFVPQGTPTNNTETVSSGYLREDVGFQTSFALEREEPKIAAGDRSNSAEAVRALGLDLPDFAHLRNADGHDELDAANINRALWPATIGYFLDQFFNNVLPGYDKDKWRDYFVDWVRARGPLPALRFGKQPYGVLPVSSLDRWSSKHMDLVNVLRRLRDLWRAAQKAVAYAGRDSTETGRDLVEALGLEAVSGSYSWRWARGPRFFDLFWRLPGQQIDPHRTDDIIRTALGNLETEVINTLQSLGLSVERFTRLKGMTFARVAFHWNGPLVEAGSTSEAQLLKYNYIRALASRDVSLDDIHDESAKLFPSNQPKPLLYQLLRQATLLAYAEQALPLWPWKWNPRLPNAPPWFEPELVDMDRDLNTDQPGDPLKTPTFWRVIKFVPPTSAVSLGDQLRSQGSAVPDSLGKFLSSLNQLAGLPTAALERLLGETLDLASHRLDAWITSLATHRLSEFRANKPTGIYLGGYGWVENLKPRTDPLLSDGYVHAPSIAQATAAAVLRSGYLTHKDQPEGARLEIDLSSKRVRLALGLIDGVRQGQPLGALLGYRFERTLHNADLALNRIIAPLRELAPLTGGKLVPKAADSSEPQEAIAANNVVDGLKLLDLKHNSPNAFDKFNPGEKAAIEAALNDIQDAVDAIGDLGLTEGVYQAVQGNYLRAGATLDAVSRGEAPGEIQVLTTPQSGVAFTQRLVALFNTPPSQTSSWNRNRARAKAEPVLNEWAEHLLGDPGHVRCKAEYFNPGKDLVKDAPDDHSYLSLATLDLCALDLIYAPPVTLTTQQTELELRLARKAMQQKPNGIQEDATVRLVFTKDANFQNDEYTFPELFEWTRTIKELITNGRALDARDLTLAGAGGDSGINVKLLTQQLGDVMVAWQQAKQELLDLLNVDQPTDAQLEELRDTLERFSAFAVQSAVPRSIIGSTIKARKDLVTQAQGVHSQVLDIEKRLEAIKGANANDSLAKFAVLFGEGFRVLLPFTLDSQHKFQPAMQRRDRAGDAGSDDVVPWLQTVARVRDGTRRLGNVLTYSQVLGTGDDMTFRVAQLPFDETDVWNLPKGPTERAGATSVVVYTHDNLSLNPAPTQAALAGLMIDEWVEVIPRRTLQTSLTFHYDAPGACAPQAILLAISPDPGKAWDTATLEAVLNETLDLAKLRTVDYDALSMVGHLLPALLIANNVGGDPHGDTVSSKFD